MRLYYPLILLLAMCNLMTMSSTAQTTDYRLSPSMLGFRLPEELQIQGAAEIGTARLVVWATAASQGREEAEGILVMNLGNLESRLTENQARPYGAVEVVPLTDRFLVLWNDRRSGGEGIYSTVVGTNGTLGQGDRLLSRGGRFADTILVAPLSSGALLLWTDLRNGYPDVRALRVGATGDPIGNELVIGSGWLGHSGTLRLPDGALVVVAGDTAVVLAPDGSFRDHTFPAARVRLPHYIGDDGSLTVLDSGRIEYYALPWSEEPLWTTDWMPESGEIALPFISRDSAGWFALSYRFWTEPGTRYYIHILRYRVEPGEPPGLPEIALFDSGAYYTQGFFGAYSVDTVIHRFGCENTYNVRFGLTGTFQAQSGNGRPPVGSSRAVEFFVNRKGTVKPLSVNPEENDFLPGPCGFLKRVRLERTKWDTISQVRAVWSGENIWRYYDTSIAGIRYRESQAKPVLLDWNGLHLAWLLPKRNAVATAPLPAFSRGIEAEPFAEGIGTLPVGRGWNTFFVPRSSYSSTPENLGGFYIYNVTSSVSHIRPGAEGWLSFGPVQMAYSNPTPVGPIRVLDFSYDPERGEYLVVLYVPAERYARRPFLLLVYLDAVGVEIRREKILWDGAEPDHVLLGGDYLLMTTGGNRGAVASMQGKLLDTVTFPHRGREGPHIVQPLLGHRFARVFLPDSLPDEVLVDVVTHYGEELGSIHLKGVQNRAQIQLLQNPVDQAIVLLWGGTGGVRVAYLDKNLHEVVDPSRTLLLTDFQASGTGDTIAFPTGIFRNDTLYIAWEDFRNGPEPEIYGTWWVVPKTLLSTNGRVIRDTIRTPPQVPVPGEDLTSGMRIISLTPNPAIGDVAVTVQSTERQAGRIELYDAAGQRMLDRWVILSQGMATYRLDVSGLSSGSYTVRIVSGTSADQSRLIVWGP